MEEGAEGSEEGQAGPPGVLTDDTPDAGTPPDGAPVDVLTDDTTLDGTPVDAGATGRRRWFATAEYLGAAVVALWLSRSFWLPGRFVVAFDTVAYTGPNYKITMDAWRAGRVPLWNEFIYGGVTHVGNPQAGVFSPTKLIGLLFDTNRAMGVTVALHLVVMAVGTVALLHRLGARPPAGFAAAVVMVANGAVLTRAIQFEQIVVLAWAPLLLCAVTAVVWADRRPWLAMSGVGAVTAMVLVAGHPQIIYQVVVLAAAWAIALVVCRRNWARVGDLVGSLAVGALAATVHVVALLAATRDSAVGAGRTPDDASLRALAATPDHLLQIVLGSVRGVDEVTFAGGFEAIGHVGVAGAFLGVVGMVLLFRDPDRRPIGVMLAATAVIGLVWAVGPRTPLFSLAYDWLPGFDFSRAFARWINVTVIAMAVAVGIAVDGLVRRPRPRIDRYWGAGAAAVVFVAALLMGAADIVAIPDRSTLIPWVLVALTVTALVVVGVGAHPVVGVLALTLLVGLELGAASRHSLIDVSTTDTAFDAWSPGPTGELAHRQGLTVAFTDDAFGNTEYLIGGFRPNTNALAGVRSLDGYDGGVQVTRRYAALLDELTGSGNIELPLRNQLPSPLTPDLAANLGIRYAVVDNARDAITSLPAWVAIELMDDRFTVWENPAWLGDAVAARIDPGTDPGTDAVTDDRRALPVRQSTPERIVVDVAATEPTAVTVHRQAGPGWSVRVDGRPAEIVERSGLFLGVDITTGARTAVFTFRPRWLTATLAASIIGTLGLLAMATVGTAGRPSLTSGGERADEENEPMTT